MIENLYSPGTTVGGGACTGTSTGAGTGMYMSSRGSAETSLTPAASSCAIVLGDQLVNATGMVVGAGVGMIARTGAGQQPLRPTHSGPCP